MKKKILLSLISLTFLTSCGESAITSPSQTTPATTTTTTTEESQESITTPEEEVEEYLYPEGKEDTSHLPYLSKLSSLKKEAPAWNGAKWIWYSKTPADSYFAFRRKFQVNQIPSKAILSLSAADKVTVWINGKLVVVDGNIKRGMSEHDSYYSNFDVTSHLKQGENLIVFEVVFWGQSGNSSIAAKKDEENFQGGLLYDLSLGEEHIVSDSKTKVKRIAAYRNKSNLKEKYPNHPTSSFLAERDIYFDASFKEDFTDESLDDSTWDDASLLCLPGNLPFGDTYYCEIPPFAFDEEVTDMEDIHSVLGKKTTSDSILTFALDENQQFLPYFELEADEKGKVITFYTNTKTTQGTTSFMDDYVTVEGKQEYQQLYYRTGYQFIMEVPAGITITKVGYRKTRYNALQTGQYQSDNKNLDTLWKKASNTLRICMRDNYMDCPERERSPYTGDAANQIAETLYALDSDGWTLAKKTYTSLLGWVTDEGDMKDVIPSRWPSKTTNEIPMQNLACIITTYDYYLHTGDKETMKLILPIYVNYLKLWNMNENGTVQYRNGTFPWVDWGNNTDSDLMEQCWYYWALERVLLLGKEVGELKDEDKTLFEQRRNSIQSVFDSIYRTENGFASVTSDGTRRPYDDRGNALAVLSGLVKEKDYDLVTSLLVNTAYASPYMERFVDEALAKMNRFTEAKQRMLTRYKGMIEYEASTLWEEWDPAPDSGTINHGWAGGPLVVMSKYFAGIQPLSAGYQSYQIKPAYGVSSSHQASATTPDGLLSFTLETKEEKTTIQVTCPNDGGRLLLDPSFGNQVTLDGESVALEERALHLNKGTHTITVQ